MSASVSSAPAATAPARSVAPPPSAPIWHALDTVHLRHAKLKQAELPTQWLHVSLQHEAPQAGEASEPAAAAAGGTAPQQQQPPLVTAEDLWHVFHQFGEVEGVRLLPPPHQQQQQSSTSSSSIASRRVPGPGPVRQFAYVQFKHKQDAAQAQQALHQKCSPLLPKVRLHLAHALERTEDAAVPAAAPAVAAGDSAASAAASAASIAQSPPNGVTVLPQFLGAAECETALQSAGFADAPSQAQNASSSSARFKQLDFGAPLPQEDDRFGMKKPPPLQQQWNETIIPRLAQADDIQAVSAASAASSSSVLSSFPPNRVSLSHLLPGRGLRRSRDPAHLYGPLIVLVNLGQSHVLLELAHPARPAKGSAWAVLLQQGAAMVLSGEAATEWEYGVAAQTRDMLPIEAQQPRPFLLPAGPTPPQGATQLKRATTTLAILRHVRAEPLPAPSEEESNGAAASSSSAAGAARRLAAKEARARKQEHAAERDDKKVHSTAIRVPGASASASPSADMSSSPAEGDAADADEAAAAAMESLHVTGVYDSIARHFSNTRHSPWPRIERFVESLEAGTKVADVGCGNGKYMGLNTRAHWVGCDASKELVRICREEKGYDVVEGDLMAVPFPSRSFDAVLCIAVLHHISTLARRQRGVRELVRLLRPGNGRLLVSAWALEQDLTSRRAFPSQDVLVPWAIPRAMVAHDERAMQVAQHTTQAQEREAAAAAAGAAGQTDATSSASCAADVVAPSPPPPAASSSPSSSPPAAAEAAPLVQFQRYCHVYREGELEELFRSQFLVAPAATAAKSDDGAVAAKGDEEPELRFVEHYYDRGNWCVVVQKLRETRFDKQEQEEEERQRQAVSSKDARAQLLPSDA